MTFCQTEGQVVLVYGACELIVAGQALLHQALRDSLPDVQVQVQVGAGRCVLEV